MPTFQPALLIFFLLTIRENRSQQQSAASARKSDSFEASFQAIYDISQSFNRITMIPNVTEQVIEAGSDIILTCEANTYSAFDGKILWQLPDFIVKHQDISDVNNRLRKTFIGKNGTDKNIPVNEFSSTITLSNARHEDTGYFVCRYFHDDGYEYLIAKQYVYVPDYTRRKLIFFDAPAKISHGYDLIVRKGGCLTIPCKSTHPNVTISLIHISFSNELIPVGGSGDTSEERLWITDSKFVKTRNTQVSLFNSTSNWSFDPKEGPFLLGAKLSDNGRYACVGQMGQMEDGEEAIFVAVLGIELERVGDPGDPQEGSNFSVICRTAAIPSNLRPFENSSQAPKWFYQLKDAGEMQLIDKANPPKGIQLTENNLLSFEQIRLDVTNITRDTPNNFRCETIKNGNKLSETISFQIKETNNATETVGTSR